MQDHYWLASQINMAKIESVDGIASRHRMTHDGDGLQN